MKRIIDVRSNTYYEQAEGDKFQLNPFLEIVILHTDGKEYVVKDEKIKANTAVTESRFLVNSQQLAELVTDLQMQQKKMSAATQNAEQLTSLVKYLSEEKGLVNVVVKPADETESNESNPNP